MPTRNAFVPLANLNMLKGRVNIMINTKFSIQAKSNKTILTQSLKQETEKSMPYFDKIAMLHNLPPLMTFLMFCPPVHFISFPR